MKHIKYDFKTKQFFELREVYHLDKGGFIEEYQPVPIDDSLIQKYQQYFEKRIELDKLRQRVNRYVEFIFYMLFGATVAVLILKCMNYLV